MRISETSYFEATPLYVMQTYGVKDVHLPVCTHLKCDPGVPGIPSGKVKHAVFIGKRFVQNQGLLCELKETESTERKGTAKITFKLSCSDLEETKPIRSWYMPT